MIRVVKITGDEIRIEKHLEDRASKFEQLPAQNENNQPIPEGEEWQSESLPHLGEGFRVALGPGN